MLFLKPCCLVLFSMFFVMKGNSIFSSVLASGDNNDISLYDVPSLSGLLGFCIIIIFECFHVCGMVFWFIILL